MTHIHAQKSRSIIVQKLEWKHTDGRTQPTALLTPLTRSVISSTGPLALFHLRRAQANAPAAWCWLRPLLDDGGRKG